jgi:hypothetical protein
MNNRDYEYKASAEKYYLAEQRWMNRNLQKKISTRNQSAGRTQQKTGWIYAKAWPRVERELLPYS